MSATDSQPSPELAVATDRRQGRNFPENRRHGFRHPHLILYRSPKIRSRRVLTVRLGEGPGPKRTISA